jgi:hypothetical protein
MTEEQVIELVREQLRNHHPGGVTVEVVPDQIRRQGEYWYIPVLPSAQPPKMYEYYEALAEVESTLEENEQLQLWLVPVVPEEVTALSSEPATT